MKQPLQRALLGLFLILGLVRAFAQGTAFTYQGRLAQNNVPATGSWDLQFTLHDAETGGGQVGSAVTELAVPVEAGQFTVTLDFGAQFNGASRWLELSAKPAGGPTYTTYGPRQPVTPTPYAIRAATAGVADSANTATTATAVSGPVAATQLTGTVALGQLPATLVQDGQTGVTLNGTFSGNGAGLTGVPGTLARVTVTGTSVSAAPNTAYYVTGSSAPNVSLPTSATLGDQVQVHGIGAGWATTLVPGIPAGASWIPRRRITDGLDRRCHCGQQPHVGRGWSIRPLYLNGCGDELDPASRWWRVESRSVRGRAANPGRRQLPIPACFHRWRSDLDRPGKRPPLEGRSRLARRNDHGGGCLFRARRRLDRRWRDLDQPGINPGLAFPRRIGRRHEDGGGSVGRIPLRLE